MPVTYYKVLGPNGQCIHGGNGEWHLPKGKRPGQWMPKVKNVKLCVRGYHLVTVNQLPQWLGPEIWIAEGRGQSEKASDKTVFEQARLISKTSWDEKRERLFAADCAEHVLPIWLKQYPNDDRPALAIQAARDFANGKISVEQSNAARAAAWDAAGAVAWDAAEAAAEAAARAAARDAARAAAGAVAWDAAEAAARDAERKWQIKRLKYYLTSED